MSTELAPLDLATEKWMAEVNELLTKSTALVDVVDESFEQAAAFQSQITKMISAMKNARLEKTRPLDAQKKRFTALEKQLITPLVKEKDRIQKANSSYLTKKRIEEEKKAQELREAEAEKAMAAEALFGTEVTCDPDPVPEAGLSVRSDNIRQVRRVKFELQDITKVDAHFICLDERAVANHIAELKKTGATTKEIQSRLPGLKVWEELQAVSR